MGLLSLLFFIRDTRHIVHGAFIGFESFIVKSFTVFLESFLQLWGKPPLFSQSIQIGSDPTPFHRLPHEHHAISITPLAEFWENGDR